MPSRRYTSLNCKGLEMDLHRQHEEKQKLAAAKPEKAAAPAALSDEYQVPEWELELLAGVESAIPSNGATQPQRRIATGTDEFGLPDDYLEVMLGLSPASAL